MLSKKLLMASQVGSTPTACETIPQDGLIASYNLTGTSQDETGTYDGTENGVTYEYDAERGVVASFDGDGDYIEIDQTLLNRGTDDFAVSFWFKEATDSDLGQTLITGYTSGSANSGVYIEIYNGDFKLVSQVKTNIISFAYTSDTNWHHCVITRNTGVTKIYIDNVEKVSSSTPIIMDNTSGTAWRIGEHLGTANSSYSYDGLLNNLHIYNRALSPTEINQIHNVEKNIHNIPIDNGLIAYYPLDGDSQDNAISPSYDSTADTATYVYDSELDKIVASFNGSGSYIVTPMHPFGGQPYSVTVNLKISSSQQGNPAVLYTMSNAAHGTYQIWHESSNYLRWVHYLNGAVIKEVDDLTPSYDEWVSYVITWDGSELAMYKNTVLIDTEVVTSYRSDYTGGTSAYIGYRGDTYYYNGLMSNFRFHNRAISPEEVSAIYEYEKPDSTVCLTDVLVDNSDPFGDGSGLVLYKLDGDAVDSGGNHDGSETSVTYSNGTFGQGAVFGSSTSKILITPFNADPDNCAISFWASCANNTSVQRPFDFRTSGSASGSDSPLGIGSYFYNGVLYVGHTSFHAVTPSDVTQLNHYVISVSNGTSSIYINGVLDSTGSFNLGTARTNYALGNTDNNNGNLAGTLDQFRIFNRGLTVSEISMLSNELNIGV
jgi:hypothetical protein